LKKNAGMFQARSVASVPANMPVQSSGILALDGVMNPIIRQGLDYWQRLRDDRPYPSREEVHPSDLRTLLRHVVLLRLVDDGADYEYRIVGDAHVQSHGFCMQGLRVSDVDRFSPGYGPVLKRLYDRAVRRREAFAFRGWLERGDQMKKYIYNESVFMPLGPNRIVIDHVLNFSVYMPRDSYS